MAIAYRITSDISGPTCISISYCIAMNFVSYLSCAAFQFVLVYRHVGPLTGENDVHDDTRFEMVALGMIQHVLILFRALPSRSYLPPL